MMPNRLRNENKARNSSPGSVKNIIDYIASNAFFLGQVLFLENCRVHILDKGFLDPEIYMYTVYLFKLLNYLSLLLLEQFFSCDPVVLESIVREQND